MPTEPRAPRSRRSILAAAAGGAAALAVSRLSDPNVAAALNPSLLLNQDNPISATTSLTGNGVQAFQVTTGTFATAIKGASGNGVGLSGESVSGWGVVASSTTGVGMSTVSTSGIALDATSGSSTAVRGSTTTGTGVVGHVGPGLPAPTPAVALFGSVEDKANVGVRALGHVQFPDRSGRVLIAAGKSYVDVSMITKGGLAGTPLCFANLQATKTGVYVASVRPNYPSSGKLRIQLNKAVASAVWVAWFVLG